MPRTCAISFVPFQKFIVPTFASGCSSATNTVNSQLEIWEPGLTIVYCPDPSSCSYIQYTMDFEVWIDRRKQKFGIICKQESVILQIFERFSRILVSSDCFLPRRSFSPFDSRQLAQLTDQENSPRHSGTRILDS